MTADRGVEACYLAFERLKNGNPQNDKFMHISPEKITASIVSQEAGFDSGYLKRNRHNHQGIIALIDDYKKQLKSSTLSKYEEVKREKQKAAKYKERLIEVEELLEKSLSREMLLVFKLAEMESLLESTLNRIPRQHANNS